MQIRSITPQLDDLKSASLALILELDGIGRDIEDQLDAALDKAWQLGKHLMRAKKLLGHGKWTIWVDSNLPISPRHALRHKQLAEDNPRAKSVKDLSEDSVRKFRLGYVPSKERPALDGDGPLPRAFHHLTIVNDFNRFKRRVDIGQAHFDPAVAKNDLWPVFEWLGGLYGLNIETISNLRPPG
ncbi:MAG: hypothetical protein P4L99_28010 [Chthoniobacter sp.]|nr:hypothetical protein [Chthoniobacter sp.]